MTSLKKRHSATYTNRNWMISTNENSQKRYLWELVYLNTRKSNHKIPRQIMSLDEKYLRHCLEMIHISAGKISLHTTSSLKTGISFVFPLSEVKYPSGSAGCFDKCSSPSALDNINSSPPGHWIIGSISGSKSMKNILNSPILRRLRDLEDDKDDSDFEFCNSGSHSIISSSQKLNRFDTVSGTDVSETDLGAIVSHGMLQCTLTGGNPHYVFSVDEKQEVYEANLLSTESSANEGLQWMYSFNVHNGRWKEVQVASTKELSHIGTMNMSPHFTTCPNNFKIMETEFVLYGHDEKSKDEFVPLSQSVRKNNGLSKKAISTFKPNLSVRKRTKSVFWRPSSTTDSCPSSPPTEVHKNIEKQTRQYCEIAAIFSRKHVDVPPKEVMVTETGGWGASILKRVTHKEGFNFQDHILSSESYRQCRNKLCSTTDIIIPAGYHSQPETGDGVPSSLIERWKSGGRCDCGGWDTGCPLTVFTTRPSENAVLGRNANENECTSFEVVLQGIERHPPQMKMVNISSNLYYLNFRSSLSALQCFAIAVAVLHCKSATLQTKMVQGIESRSMEVGKDVEFCSGRVY